MLPRKSTISSRTPQQGTTRVDRKNIYGVRARVWVDEHHHDQDPSRVPPEGIEKALGEFVKECGLMSALCNPTSSSSWECVSYLAPGSLH